MISLYSTNGLVFFEKKEIEYRNYCKTAITEFVKDFLISENKAWKLFEIEAPILTPHELLNKNYSETDVFLFDSSSLGLRPETTPGSYEYAKWLLNSQYLPPITVYQMGKSFRREQDQVTKNMRLKEFYQLEFQCLYSADTKNDYQQKIIEPIRSFFETLIGKKCRSIESDRLPSYSLKTIDIEVMNPDKWMEICSISVRNDFPGKLNISGTEKDILVLEVAIGMDRLIYNHFIKNEND